MSQLNITFNYQPDHHTITTTSIPYQQLNPETISFSIDALAIFEEVTIRVNVQNQLIGNMILGEEMVKTVNVTALDAATPHHFGPFSTTQIVNGSYDPNDKQVLQGQTILIDQVDQELHYLIRFQNTGTAEAIFVRIFDFIDESLDFNSLRILDASHPYTAQINEQQVVTYHFSDIMLPSESQNEPESHGYVLYSIKPKPGKQVGDIITGLPVSIYFDYNPPIITNRVETEVIAPLAVQDPSVAAKLRIMPNPTTGIINLEAEAALSLHEVELYNLQGRQLEFKRNSDSQLDISSLQAGVYVLKLTTSAGTHTQRIVKK